jgi:hypothetical protein
VLLSKTNSILRRKQCGRFDAANVDHFPWRDTCVSQTHLNRLIGGNRANLHLETPRWQSAFFSNTNSLLIGNNVLDSPSSNTDDFLLREKCASSTQLNRLSPTKGGFSSLKILLCRSIPLKNYL